MPQFGRETFTKVRFRGGSGSYILMPVLTTTQRDALTAVTGMVIFNSTTGQLEEYNGSVWRAIGKGYSDTTFLPLAGGALTGDVTVAATKTIDGVDISAHAAALDGHTKSILELARTGQYYLPINGGWANQTLTANMLYATFLYVARAITIDRIAVWVSTADAVNPNIRLGIYNDGANLYPGTLLLDAGVVSAATTGLKAIEISQALTKGLYWVVAVSDGTPTLRATDANTMQWTPLGLDSTDITANLIGWTVAFTYAALPNPFTAGGTAQRIRLREPVRILSLD